MSYNIAIQKTRTKPTRFCVCLTSIDNGKLVLKGEPINKLADAFEVAGRIRMAFNDKRVSMPNQIEVLPATHKWPTNAGPKKKVAKTARAQITRHPR